MPDRLDGKLVLTNTLTPSDVEALASGACTTLVSTTPDFGGRSFGTNVLEAALLTLVGKPWSDNARRLSASVARTASQAASRRLLREPVSGRCRRGATGAAPPAPAGPALFRRVGAGVGIDGTGVLARLHHGPDGRRRRLRNAAHALRPLRDHAVHPVAFSSLSRVLPMRARRIRGFVWPSATTSARTARGC